MILGQQALASKEQRLLDPHWRIDRQLQQKITGLGFNFVSKFLPTHLITLQVRGVQADFGRPKADEGIVSKHEE